MTSPTTALSLHAAPSGAPLDADWLRAICKEAGAADVGFVAVDRPEVAGEHEHAIAAFPRARTFVSLVFPMNREPIRSPARSIANLEFHHTGEDVDATCRRIVKRLAEEGVGALNPAMGFPMEVSRFPGRIWVISHKTVAEAAGMGKMGIHRNLIHPKLGNFILLGTLIIDREVGEEGAPLVENPCLECKLCVAACPVGAVKADGAFDFASCYTHNYREFMGGFTDWVENVVESGSAKEYRERVADHESISMWQSLGFGPNYKAAYCMAVCPAGEDVIGPYLEDKRAHKQEVLRPLQVKEEIVYVVPGSDAEQHVERRFPTKTTKQVRSGLRPVSIAGFLAGLPLLFQRGAAAALDATYHFTFTGSEEVEATVVIRDQLLSVRAGHEGRAGLRLVADADTWLGFLREERSLVRGLLSRKIRLRGSPRLLQAFAACFPS